MANNFIYIFFIQASLQNQHIIGIHYTTRLARLKMYVHASSDVLVYFVKWIYKKNCAHAISLVCAYINGLHLYMPVFNDHVFSSYVLNISLCYTMC